MVKSICYIIVSVLILIGGTIGEQIYLDKSFEELKTEVSIIDEKIDDKTVTVNDLEKLKNSWLKQKERLHTIIPHTEIKEIDLWVSEALAYAEIGKYDETKTKLTVIDQLFKQIPKIFKLRIENIF
ncbi:MAG: DUF4363 family protein [Clostridia bacterium]|nr:DUF4363 family protein [Clostridia bacterium]